MKLEGLQKEILQVDALWEQTRDNDDFRGWYGYGIRKDRDLYALTVFARNKADLKLILDTVSRLFRNDVRLQGFVVPRFRQLSGGKFSAAGSTPLKPGNIVFAVGKKCFSCPGTIGGFLASAPKRRAKKKWLLSNHHVLAECPSKVQVFGENNFLVGKKVRSAPVGLVDAALVELPQGMKINPHYGKLGKLIKKKKMKVPFGATVRKLGRATGLTSGHFIGICRKVIVFDCSDTGSAEFTNQLMIGAKKKKNPFADKGDSGSLVVSKQNPIGLLFAATSKGGPKDSGCGFKPPFFLANPLPSVIDELSKVVKAPLDLIL